MWKTTKLSILQKKNVIFIATLFTGFIDNFLANTNAGIPWPKMSGALRLTASAQILSLTPGSDLAQPLGHYANNWWKIPHPVDRKYWGNC